MPGKVRILDLQQLHTHFFDFRTVLLEEGGARMALGVELTGKFEPTEFGETVKLLTNVRKC